MELNIHFRNHAEICQFLGGLNQVGSLHRHMQLAPDAFSSLFVHQNVILDFTKFRTLYEVQYSPEGSNKRILEKDTVYCFEAFLMDCTGNKLSIDMLRNMRT